MKILYTTILALILAESSGFTSPRTVYLASSSTQLYKEVERYDDGTIKKGPLEFIMDPKPTKIPPELKDEIFKAEGNTEAARQRQGRVLNYTILAVILVGCAFSNVFLTEFRSTVAEEAGRPISLDDVGWGWVEMNSVFKFFLTSKIGGAVALIGGATSGMMVEAEVDSQRENAEKIWSELEKRRLSKEQRASKKKKTKKGGPPPPSKKKRSSTQKKRLAALSEVILEDEPESVQVDPEAEEVIEVEEKEDGLMGKIKEFYSKADSMAASQALLLNKELEDKGVLDKITDESGLKVIGKDAAAKSEEEKSRKSSSK
jgi:hypothetical protein